MCSEMVQTVLHRAMEMMKWQWNVRIRVGCVDMRKVSGL